MTNENVTEKTTINAGDDYQTAKSASGSISKHSGDVVALALLGLTLDETYQLACEALDVPVADLQTKYEHLNDGMQRMNLGNRIRGVITKIDRNNEKEAAKEDGQVGISGDEYVRQLAAPFQEAREEREAKAAAEKQAKAEAAAEAKAEKERIAAEKKAAKEAKAEQDSEEE